MTLREKVQELIDEAATESMGRGDSKEDWLNELKDAEGAIGESVCAVEEEIG